MTDLVLDSAALTMWAANDHRLLTLLETARRVNGVVLVPTVCLVESLTGGPRDAPLNHRLKGTRRVPLDEVLARAAAHLRAAVGGEDAADPVVVATAASLSATVISTDDDVRTLAAHASPPVRVVDPRG